MPICFIVMWSIFFLLFLQQNVRVYQRFQNASNRGSVLSPCHCIWSHWVRDSHIYYNYVGETVAKWLMSWGGDMMVLGVKRLKICTFLSEVEIWSDSSWSTVVFFPLQRHWECQGCVWPHEVSVNISFIQCSWAWLSLENEREVQSMFGFE